MHHYKCTRSAKCTSVFWEEATTDYILDCITTSALEVHFSLLGGSNNWLHPWLHHYKCTRSALQSSGRKQQLTASLSASLQVHFILASGRKQSQWTSGENLCLCIMKLGSQHSFNSRQCMTNPAVMNVKNNYFVQKVSNPTSSIAMNSSINDVACIECKCYCHLLVVRYW